MRHTTGKRTTLLFAVSVLALTLCGAVWGARALELDGSFSPTRESIYIFPSEIESVGWANTGSLLIQDLGEHALFQSFGPYNSAYLGKDETGTQTNASEDAIMTESDAVSETATSTDTDSIETHDIEGSETATGTTPTASEDPEVTPQQEAPSVEPEQTNESDPAETTSINEDGTQASIFDPLTAVTGFWKRVTGAMPWAQVSTTTDDSPEEVLEDISTTTTKNNEVDLQFSDESTDSNENVPAPQDDATTTASTADDTTSNAKEEIATTTPPTNDIDTELGTTTIATSTATTTTAEVSTTEEPKGTRVENSITLRDFGIPQLESGQFIDGVQLRLSLGGAYELDASSSIPAVDVSYSFGSLTGNAGSVLLDEELSNSLNGGYFVVALPSITNPEVLRDLSVTLTYDGDIERLEHLYVDAVWLDISVVTYDKNLLKRRASAEGLLHLKRPEFAELLSDELDFERNDTPLFSLRYNSQRNFFVRTARALFGRDLAKVNTVEVKHRSLGPVGTEPEITVTEDGLITVALREEDKAKLRPGQYTVEIEIAEGGKVFRDSFDFQWGLLSINSSKSEYVRGEVAAISMGALTPNGNTLCNADLRLYVVDPKGYISLVPVAQSGQCNGNNVVDVPDYSTQYVTDVHGEYEMYLERLDEAGNVIAHTSDVFRVVNRADFTLERVGPTRIYPAAPYDMSLVLRTNDASINGELIERVPSDFAISNTDAHVRDSGEYKELVWDVSSLASSTKVFTYTFDAPDLSPFLYLLGPAELSAKRGRSGGATTTGSSTSERSDGSETFTEYRAWQIASDATGNMILFWDDNGSIPSGWTCLSCGSGTFYQNFVQGDATYNSIGGSATHNHTADGSVLTTTSASNENFNSGSISALGHTHTYTPTIEDASNLPSYRQLRVIQYTSSAGEPATIPAGAIGIFDSSVPTGWTRYSAQDGFYIRGEDTAGTTGGSNTHTHTISGSTAAAGGSTLGARGGGTQQNGASAGHTHAVSGATGSNNHEPPYIEVILGQIDSNGTPPVGMISMWTEDVAAGWIDVSSSGGDPFNGRFIKGATSYGTTGGGSSHTHSNVTGITSSGPSATTNGRSGTAGASDAHTHEVHVTDFSTDNHLPPYVTAVFGKRIGLDAAYEQLSYRWYVDNDAQTPTDPWPQGAGDLLENEPLTATSTVVSPSDVIRLRINAEVTNSTSTAGTDFVLQYGEGATCSAIDTWLDVGDTSSSTALWRGHNTAATDHSTLSSTTLTDTTVSETFEENGYATGTPNDIGIGEVGEWDFVLEHNGAAPGTDYCFRMVESDGSGFLTYTNYPRLRTNAAPNAPSISKLFDNEKTASTTPWFEFSTTDPESEGLTYQIQIDNNYDFDSTVMDRNTITHSSEFDDLTVGSEKDPYPSGDIIRFRSGTTLANGTTYYVRTRARDADGSNEWGSWSTIQSFTIDTSLDASAWFQTEGEQFDTNTLVGVETDGGDDVSLISGSTTGSMTTNPIEFDAANRGTAWGQFTYSETDSGDVLDFHIEYLTDEDSWELIPDSELSGNSTGLTSGVSLLDLDTDVYGTLRIVAEFTGSTGGPAMSDWTLEWGYRIETPTITALFPNEKVGTTTPTFIFSTTDPQGDPLTYEVSYSTEYDFSASTTVTSSTSAGFINGDDGGDTDPFTSGDDVRYTFQSALSNNTTYWWRVRAIDPTGENAYSFWTDPRSFTIDTTVTASTWFQTTEEQFETDILSGTAALSTDTLTVATTATEAMLVYGEGTDSVPRYRQWDGSDWSDEDTLPDVDATVSWAVVRAGVTREEYIAGILSTDGDLNVSVFTDGEWSAVTEMTTSIGNTNARGYDITYESSSGDAMVMYCDGDDDPSYRIWNGSSWSSESSLTTNSGDDCEWLALASDPTSDEIVVVTRDVDGSEYEAQVWDGSSWDDSSVFGTSRDATYSGIAVSYEASGGQAIAVAPSPGGGPNRMVYNVWNGTSWTGETTQTIGGRLYWADFARNVGTDDMVLCYINDATDVRAIRWTGSGWTGDALFSGDVNASSDPAYACIYETTSGNEDDIVAVYSDTDSTDYRIYDSGWGGASQVNSIGDASTMQLVRTGEGAVLGLFFDDPNDSLLFAEWDGSSWSTTATIEDDASVDSSPFGHPYGMAPRNAGIDGSAVVAPGINFDEGVGPYWEEFSWNDSTPGSSEILYLMQYWDGDSWELIPDVDLPGNTTGTTTSPVDLSGLNISTYSLIRPRAELTCEDADTCPELQDWTVEWAEGITISGTLLGYDQSTPINSGTVAVAVNGELQVGKTGAVAGGVWSISNVTTFAGDVITVFVDGAAPDTEAVGVTRYDGNGDIEGLQLYERHLALGSNDATSTPLTNADIGLYNVNNDEDVFFDLSGTALTVCADVDGCFDAELFINASTTYNPQGTLVTHDLENNGILIATTTLYVDGSWDNNATTTLTGSTVVFSATSTTESIDETGANSPFFNNLTFGTTTGNATWSLQSPLDVNGNLTVARGTLARGTEPITIAGNLSNGASGFWNGIGTTTFDGAALRNWRDQNATLQNVGNVVINGSSKNITLNGNVAAESITIGADDIFDVSTSHYDVTVYGDWINNNTFAARQGTVFMSATSSGFDITAGGDSFYDLTFNGTSGGWSFTEANLTVGNDLTISEGTVNLPTGTTTIGGSFDATNGTFAHNNGTFYFTSSGAETITADGSGFTNAFYNLTFDGSGSWSITDTNATSSNNVRVESGTLTLPSGIFSVDGSLVDDGGTIAHNSGTVQLTSSGADVLTFGGSTLNNLTLTGSGNWSITDTNATLAGDLTILAGTLTLPSGTLTLGGSLQNNATLAHNSGTILFNSSDTGEIIDAGGSDLSNLTFINAGGGWTITESATTTGDVTLTAANDLTLASGRSLSIYGSFTNAIGGATTWTGSTLSLQSGTAYPINSKAQSGDQYDTLIVGGNTDVSMWYSEATTTTVSGSGSLYSQDHGGVDGALNIYGSYERTSGTEYWSYATDFDGASLTGSERQAQVRFSSGASAAFTTATLSILGDSAASTTIDALSGTYTVDLSSSTINARYYEFADLGSTGVSLLASTTVTSLRDGSYTVAQAGGAGMTLASTTIDTNPALQIFNVNFATTTPISAFNVAQTDGTPTSNWWFRNSTGNLDGEAYDNDTGDPGSVRWDDSSLTITVEGTVYTDEGTTPLAGGTCDGVTNVVRLIVEGGGVYDEPCGLADGFFSIPNVVITGDPTLSIFLNDAAGGEHAVAVTKTPTGDIDDMDLYVDRVIVRHESTEAMTIEDMAAYDNTDDTDMLFSAATGTPDTLIVDGIAELHVHASSTFAPGGNVTLLGGAGNAWSGTLHVDNGATFESTGTETHTIGGRFQVDLTGSFSAASSSVLMTATSTGKNITTPSPQTIDFNTISFIGSSGEWSVDADITVADGMALSAGSIIGTGDITIASSSLSGTGTVAMTGGTVTLERTNTLGDSTPWSFYNLTLGNGSVAGVTTRGGSSTTTILGTLTIATGHTLDANDSNWDLRGLGTVFIENGTFLEDTSRVRYSTSTSANVLGTTYYDLDISGVSGSPTFTATGIGINVLNDLTVGGGANTTLDLNANDTTLSVGNDLIIRNTGTLSASDSGSFTVSGSYDNDGTFTANGGTITFNTSGSDTIAAGGSSFANVIASSTGTLTITEHATATDSFTIGGGFFTVNSGVTLAVGDDLSNLVDGAFTTWTGSTLRLYGGAYEINPKTTEDTYETLVVGANTDVSMWNSGATTITVDSTGSLYSQDHDAVNGHLFIYGDYQNTSGTDHWSYATDFDGTSLMGSERAVTVFIEDGASVGYQGGGLSVLGDASASTTVRNQGTGTYALTIGGSASTTWSYYALRNIDSDGLVITGTPNVVSLSFGDIEVSENNGSGMTVGAAAIDANPAKNFTQNRFATTTAITATNVTATGSAASSWRFTNHYGNLDGEVYDNDPGGDPGYIVWDDSAANITISGNVYENEALDVSTVCDGSTNNVRLVVAGVTAYTTSCNGDGLGGGTGAYSFTNVAYSANDSFVVYIDGEAVDAANVTVDPISSIANMHLYEDRVVVRHENTDPITIDDLAVYDSSDDADIPFTALSGAPDTLTLPADTKLIVWNAKTFAPGGNVTLSGGGSGASYDGTLELRTGATFEASGSESHSIGGSLTASSSASFEAANATVTFTSDDTGRVIDVNEDAFHNIVFNGAGSWTVNDASMTVNNDLTITAGSVTLASGTTTIAGSFDNTGGSFYHSTGTVYMTATAGGESIEAGGADFYELIFNGAGGGWTFADTNATVTADLRIDAGDVTLPSGTLAIGDDFIVESGSITHNSGTLLLFATSTGKIIDGNGSDFGGITIAGAGSFSFADPSVTLLGDLTMNAGSLTLATNTLTIGGSFLNTGGSFDHATGTILFNSGDTGEFVDPGDSDFYNVTFANAAGGWTISGNATTTNNFTLTSAANFTLASGVTLAVEGIFTNSEGGADTTWTGSTLRLGYGGSYQVGAKTVATEQYENLVVYNGTDIRLWNSGATTTTVTATSSVYSQDHAGNNGHLYIFGDYTRATGTDYWSYATDFDGTSLTGSERQVQVYLADGATTTITNPGVLNIVGASGNETTVQNQGAGTYAFLVSNATLNAQYYSFSDLDADGLQLLGGSTAVNALSPGSFELAVNGGALITVDADTLNANASQVFSGVDFSTTTAITGTNVLLSGTTSNAWTFTGHTGNLDGEAYDNDGAFDGCGAVRWDDSTCLLVQQTEFRWREDNGGEGVPDSEWFDSNWSYRKQVRVENNDASAYGTSTIKLEVTYDADMQSDFDDLRFTDSTGLTEIPYFIESVTPSATATVWVQISSLPSNGVTTVYMYYGNAVATDASSGTTTFAVLDDFEDDDISEYSGDTSLFNVGTTFNYERTYGLDMAGNETEETADGIYRNDVTVAQGQTIRYFQYVDATETGNESCALFGVQNPGSNNQNYAVCFELFGSDRISLAKNVTSRDISGTVLATTSMSYSTGWYEVEIDWQTGGDIDVTVLRDGAVVATVSDNDTDYTSGGIGFSAWGQHGGWDIYSARTLIETEPNIFFGVEQTDGGASWLAAQNAPATGVVAGDRVRVRFMIENSGTDILDQNFRLEAAPKGAAPSCEAVSGASYTTVPPQASCGTSGICMQTSSNITNQASTIDLLSGGSGTFTQGQIIESPSNSTGDIDVLEDQYTEVEYVITPTFNVTDSNYCLRVTDDGTTLDSYLEVAELEIRFAPSISALALNGGIDIALMENSTTTVYATGTVSDQNGYQDLAIATATIFRSGVGENCTPDDNNCYISAAPQCGFENCAGNSCDISCYVDIYYFADPTDFGTYAGETWRAFVIVEDQTGETATGTAPSIDLSTTRAIDVENTIDYGSLSPESDTGTYNASTTIINVGNDSLDVSIEGTDLSDGGASTIPASSQIFATTTFDYSSCVICSQLATSSVNLEVDLAKPTSTAPAVTDVVYWGISIPFGIAANPHEGVNTFYAIGDQ